MPRSPERLGKAHEKSTRDVLNGDDPQPDTEAQLAYLDDDQRERVRIGAREAARFVREHTPFAIERAIEEGDARKTDPTDDVDVVVHGEGRTKGYSLKLTSSTAINVRNTLASKVAEDVFGKDVSVLLTPEEFATYERVTREFVAEECGGSDMAAAMTPVFAEKFRAFRDADEATLRERLLEHVRLDANVVACKVTAAGNFHGFASMERAPLRKFQEETGELSIYTTESNDTSIFFDVDDEAAFRIDMYGQYSGSTRKPRIKTVYRVTFG
ncbi:hypothetical protein DQW50_01165 [Halorubrum sp. 48-1-W]|uniref:hypothetical protein n=1 Tax=Halorubrum sp. 48-1-W TaxID=2249761 RepID=UPI000DCBBC41|nr:hypothetical protein [Halorubrum sp. 48-1-W]RAW47021.1 hypothetical protein DQW50_01165 [Halorubrum sp. 48-1-W]